MTRLQREINAFLEDPYTTEGHLYLDETGALNTMMEIDIGDLANEEPEVIDEILEVLTDGVGYFEQSQYSQGRREWSVHQCLGETVIFNESPERNCYAIYSRELSLEVDSVIDSDHGFAIIEQAMRRVGVFENIVSTDYYGSPTLLSNPLSKLTDKELQTLIDNKEEQDND